MAKRTKAAARQAAPAEDAGQTGPEWLKKRIEQQERLLHSLRTMPKEHPLFQHESREALWNAALSQLQRLQVQELEARLTRVATAAPAKAKSKGAVFNRTRGTLTLGGKPLTLTRGERCVLQRLTETGTASLSELQDAHERPDRVLKGLRKKHPGLNRHIHLPGGPGKGGYSTTITAEG